MKRYLLGCCFNLQVICVCTTEILTTRFWFYVSYALLLVRKSVNVPKNLPLSAIVKSRELKEGRKEGEE